MSETKRRASTRWNSRWRQSGWSKVARMAAVTAKILGIPKAEPGELGRLAKGELKGAGDKPVSPEHMELARLSAELARVRRWSATS
jgi:hypothetical protein